MLENVFEIEMDMGDRKQWTKNPDEPVLDLGKHLKKIWGNPGDQFSGKKKNVEELHEIWSVKLMCTSIFAFVMLWVLIN